jgi:hypothetical protein
MKFTYSHFDLLLADPINPLSEKKATFYMLKIYQALDAFDTELYPELHHWQTLSDVANMLETLTKEFELLEDKEGVIKDGIDVLSRAYKRKEAGLPNTIDYDDLTMLRQMVNSYSYAIETLPERIMVSAHRATEKRIRSILTGNKKDGDIIL